MSVAKPRIIGENDEPLNLSPENETDDFWHTSVGKFRFNIEDLPEQLQYIHKLLKVGNRFRWDSRFWKWFGNFRTKIKLFPPSGDHDDRQS